MPRAGAVQPLSVPASQVPIAPTQPYGNGSQADFPDDGYDLSELGSASVGGAANAEPDDDANCALGGEGQERESWELSLRHESSVTRGETAGSVAHAQCNAYDNTSSQPYQSEPCPPPPEALPQRSSQGEMAAAQSAHGQGARRGESSHRSLHRSSQCSADPEDDDVEDEAPSPMAEERVEGRHERMRSERRGGEGSRRGGRAGQGGEAGAGAGGRARARV